MGDKKKPKRYIDNENSGFTLLELLVSIIILALVILPLMNNFFRAAKINQRAEKLQDYNIVVSNILEDMKSLKLSKLLSDYASQRVYFDSATGCYTTDPTASEDGIYYFSLENITEEDSSYDAIVKVSADTYRYDSADLSHDGILLNNYEIPNIITVNSNVNAMLFAHMYRDTVTNTLSSMDDPLKTTDKSVDKIVLEYFKVAAEAYADTQFETYSALYSDYMQKLTAYQNGEIEEIPVRPTRSSIPTSDPQYSVYGNPAYCQESFIQSYIERSFDILLTDEEISAGKYNSRMNYQITYTCHWPFGLSISENNLTFTLEAKNYGFLINNIYLYYDVFNQGVVVYQPDNIRVTNNSGRAVDCYIVKQVSVVPSPSIKFFRFGSKPANIYTNMQDSQVKEYTIDSVTGAETAVDETTNQNTVNNDIIKAQKQDRIFAIEAKVFPHSTDAIGVKYLTEELYQLNSNRTD